MNKLDKTKVQTAITIYLSQNPEGLTAEELSILIRKLPLGIAQSNGEISSSEIAAILKTWKGFGRKNGVIRKNKENPRIRYLIEDVKG